jgi:hypothetical protein
MAVGDLGVAPAVIGGRHPKDVYGAAPLQLPARPLLPPRIDSSGSGSGFHRRDPIHTAQY